MIPIDYSNMTREEAIRRIKAWNLDSDDMEVLATIIPEFKESEDERARKALIEVLHRLPANAFDYGAEGGYIGATKEQMLAYLEKQKEIGIRWFESDNMKNPDKPYIDKAGMFYTTDGRMCLASEIEKQKEYKPEWDVEDKLMIKCCLRALEHYKYTGKPNQFMPARFNIGGYLATVETVENWLKSLCPQPHWRPNEKQMEALKNSAYGAYQNGDGPALRELYEQLEKL